MRTVGDLVRGKSFYSVTSDQSVYDTIRYLAEKDIGAVPVLQDNRLVGIFSERDVIKRLIVGGKDLHHTSIAEVMTTEVVVAQASERVEEVLDKMQKNRCRHMPVVNADLVVGFLSLRDLLFADLEQKNAQVEQLNTYVYYSPENPKTP